MPQGFTH